jgi:hypothetical protein
VAVLAEACAIAELECADVCCRAEALLKARHARRRNPKRMLIWASRPRRVPATTQIHADRINIKRFPFSG